MQGSEKFRYPKVLIGMALRDGWTQAQIADACRTQQSVVSRWKGGDALAKESQLGKLLEIDGPRLRRKTFRVYHDLREGAGSGWVAHLIKVEGEIVFTFPFRNRTFCTQCHKEASACSCSRSTKKTLATRKLIVHAMGNGEFCCLRQRRMVKDQYQMQFPETNVFITTVVGKFNTKELLACFDSLQLATEQDDKPGADVEAERLMLQMLSRKALLEHGYPVEGVEEHRMSW